MHRAPSKHTIPLAVPHLDDKTMPILRIAPHQIRAESRDLRVAGRAVDASGAKSRKSSIYAGFNVRQSLHIGLYRKVVAYLRKF